MDSNSAQDSVSPSVEIQETNDGSHTLYRSDLDETYHSHKGALGESEYVFVEQGLAHFFNNSRATDVTIFEVGMGTGLNALLSWRFGVEEHKSIHYHTVEPYPVPAEVFQRLNYAKDHERNIFHRIHEGDWDQALAIEPDFTLFKYRQTLEDFHKDIRVDVVFMDAFAPSKQPEVWAEANLQKCYKLLNPGGVLVTYCAQGQFKRDLKSCGFEVISLPGALGKKEMVRAVKS